MWGETTRVENRGETTRGETTRGGGNVLGAKRLVTAIITIRITVFSETKFKPGHFVPLCEPLVIRYRDNLNVVNAICYC